MPVKLSAWYSAAGQGLSIHTRTLLSISIALILFLSLAGIVFDRYFVKHAENNLYELLQNHLYGLLAAANEDEQGKMRLPEILADPKLNRPESGLLAMVNGEAGEYRWFSASYLGNPIPVQLNKPMPGTPGEFQYQAKILLDKPELKTSKPSTSDLKEPMADSYARLDFTVIWEDLSGHELLYTLSVMSSRAAIESQISGFRQVLWQWFVGLVLVLLLVQGAALNWGLRPLRQASDELQSIENGEQEKLTGAYPQELTKLTGNINSLLQHSSASLQRYRNSLGDMAHSLKTPLAVMQSAWDSRQPEQLEQAVSEQLQRIDELISYQLQKARIMGEGPVTIATRVNPVFEKVLSALNKVYAEKGVSCQFNPSDDIHFRGDQSDLMEVVGNLLDNAYKYCHHQVKVQINVNPNSSEMIRDENHCFFSFDIIDDGHGIPPPQREILFQRGKRADQSCLPEGVVGHGIGLSIVSEIIHLYGGRLEILTNKTGELSGLWLRVTLPAICPKSYSTRC